MDEKNLIVMGAGEVGRHLARTLSSEGHSVTLIDNDPEKQRQVEDQLDAAFVFGNGAQIPTLEAANAADCDVFVAASSSDEANLAASLLAKQLGAHRSVVRVQNSEDVTHYGRLYERTFCADLLLSTQLLTTTQVVNHVLGHNTLEVEYLASGALQVHRTAVESGSILAQRSLAELDLPADCLVLAYVNEGQVRVPTGNDRANVGEEALIIGTPRAIEEMERRISLHSRRRPRVVIAGGGTTAEAVMRALTNHTARIQVIERDRETAEQLAARFPQHDVLHADATDASALAAEGAGATDSFVALTNDDQTNLMACLLAQELGAKQLTALVRKSETSSLWQRMAVVDVVSPRTVAADRIRSYIENHYEPHIVSFENGAAQFVQRRVHPQSPVVDARLDEIEVPRGLIVAAILRDGAATIPSGQDALRVGDDVVLFIQESELGMAQLLFPGPDTD